MTLDDTIKQFVANGYAIELPNGKFKLTEYGEKAFKEMVQSDPEYFQKIFPEWVKIEWIH